jgi:preprotein translocase subunit SecB
MPVSEKSGGQTLYPIQPVFIVVREVHLISHRPPRQTDHIDESRVQITHLISEFNEEEKQIQVTLCATLGSESPNQTPNLPFFLRVSVTGQFSISDSFPREKIKLWANVNAPYVIYPYLRERFYYFSSQAGYLPVMLPLLQIPTLRTEKTETTDESKR